MGTRSFKKKSRKNMGRRTHGYGNCQGRRKTGRKHGKGVTTGWKKGMKSTYLKQKALGFPTKKSGKNRESIWEIGKHGFHRPQDLKRIYKVKCINIGSVNAQIEQWVQNNLAEKTGDEYSVDLEKVGYQKLLAKGTVDKKMNITVKKASAYAVEEIENAGGKVILITQ